MKLILLSVLFITAATTSYANNDQLCLPPKDYSGAVALERFSKGRLPTEKELIGTWNQVGFVSIIKYGDPEMNKPIYDCGGYESNQLLAYKLDFSKNSQGVLKFLVSIEGNEGENTFTYESNDIRFLLFEHEKTILYSTCRILDESTRNLVCVVDLKNGSNNPVWGVEFYKSNP